MSRIKVVSYEESDGRLKEIYDELIGSRGKLADVHMIQSLRPESIVKHMELYMEIMFSRSELSRADREMIAVVVSLSNKCEYCQTHHGEALNNYWKDKEKLDGFKTDYNAAGLNDKQMSLCEYAKKMTLNPGEAISTDLTASLKENGLSDEAILDASLVVSYFNFVNRMVLGLGVHLENHEGTGFKY
jgi:uncharacterized peroxidase-related enzyme